MKYIYEKVKLKPEHPQWPNAVGYKLKNVETGEFEFGFYTEETDAVLYMRIRNDRGY